MGTNEMNEHRFTEGEGKTIIAGKSEYPDFLRVYIKREDALTFALNILRKLENPRLDENPLIEIPLFGKLTQFVDEDN